MDSVARLGAYGGPRLERLWVQTHSERLYLWDWAAACDEGAEGAPAHGLGCAGDACVCNASGGVLQVVCDRHSYCLHSSLVGLEPLPTMIHNLRFIHRM